MNRSDQISGAQDVICFPMEYRLETHVPWFNQPKEATFRFMAWASFNWLKVGRREASRNNLFVLAGFFVAFEGDEEEGNGGGGDT
jgi:hypothetical protein